MMFLFKCVRWILLGLFFVFMAPFVGGLWYSLCGPYDYEQAWLNKVIIHCQKMRVECDDPELIEVLDYTITHYSKVGPWHVMVTPCIKPFDGDKTIGLNCPWSPGITIDPEVLTWSVRAGSAVVLHETLHDFYPYFGHKHIIDREEKLYLLSRKTKM